MLRPWMMVAMALAVLPRAYCEESSTLQALLQMPPCARNCFAEVLPTVPCQATNMTCLCESPHLEQGMTTCLLASCAVKETLLALNMTATSCHAPIRDRSQEYIRVNNAFGILSAIFVIERFAYKIWAKMDLAWDDWMTLFTLISGIPNTVINTYGVARNGLGRDVWTLEAASITNFVRYFFILEIIYFFEVAMLKLSLLSFYVRIFPTKWAQRLLWGTIVVSAVFGITFVLVATFQCAPMNYYWVMWDGEHEGKCLDVNAIAWSNAGISIALDVWMLAIPLWQLKDLNLDWRRKVGVAMMFCVGTLVTVVSVLRLRSLVKFGFPTMNPTWDYFDTGIWSTVEINVGLICVCMPSLRLLLVRLIPGLRSTTQRYYDKYPSDPNQPNVDGNQGKMGVHVRNKSGRGSRLALGNVVSSWADRSRRSGAAPNGITFETTYSVEYGAHDARSIDLRELKETPKLEV